MQNKFLKAILIIGIIIVVVVLIYHYTNNIKNGWDRVLEWIKEKISTPPELKITIIDDKDKENRDVNGCEKKSDSCKISGVPINKLELFNYLEEQGVSISWVEVDIFPIKRVIDISLDVSNSIKNINSKNRYSDDNLKRFKEYLEVNNFLPGDYIIARLFGGYDRYSGEKLPKCKIEKEWEIGGYKWKVRIIKSTKNNEILIMIGDQIELKNQYSVNDNNKIFEEIKVFYNKNLEEEDKECSSWSYLLSHLNSIDKSLNSSKLNKYLRKYIFITDGEFQLFPSESENFEYDYLINKYNKEVNRGYVDKIIAKITKKLEDSFQKKICKEDEKNEVFFIGIPDHDSLEYKELVEKIYDDIIFKNCLVIYKYY